MKVGVMSLGFGMLGFGAMMQSGASVPYDLGEAVKPLEEFGTGVAKAGGAVAKAVASGVEIPPWLLTIALLVLLVRFVLFSPAVDKVVQGRNDAKTHQRDLEIRELAHKQELERLKAEYDARRPVDGNG